MRILRIQTNTQQLRVRYPWPIMVSTKGVYNIFVARATGKNLEDRRMPITKWNILNVLLEHDSNLERHVCGESPML